MSTTGGWSGMWTDRPTSMRSLTPRARWLAAGVAFIVAAVVVFVGAIGMDRDRSVPVTVGGYQHTADPRQIVVNVMVGLSYDITEHTAREDAASVTVRNQAHAPGGTWPAIGIRPPGGGPGQ